MNLFDLDAGLLADASAEDIASFMDQLAREYFLDEPDRRAEPRYRATIPVTAQPIDERGNPMGDVPFRAVTRDLSASGIGLICQDPINGDVLINLIAPSGAILSAPAKVLRCEPSGYYYNVGCKFHAAINKAQ